MGDGDRGGGAGNAREIMMFGQPHPLEAPVFRMQCDIARMVERGADIAGIGDAGEFENGEGDHGRGLVRGGG